MRASTAMKDFLGVLALLGGLKATREGPNKLVYMSMIYGKKYNRYLKNFARRAQAVGIDTLVLFTLDEEAFELCLQFNRRLCVRGSPSIINKFTLPLMFLHGGMDVFWVDSDVFFLRNPTPLVNGPSWHPSFEVLISDSFTTECICSGVILFRSTPEVRQWLLTLIEWMYSHPYEHDQKLVSAFLEAGEEVAPRSKLPVGKGKGKSPIPRWAYLESKTEFATAKHVEDTGWTGSLHHMYVYHFLHGESDAAKGINMSESRGDGITFVDLMFEFYGDFTPRSLFENGSLLPHEASSRLELLLHNSYREPSEWRDDRPRCTGVAPWTQLQ